MENTAPQNLCIWDRNGRDLEGWHANAADGSRAVVSVEQAAHGAALRFDFELSGPTSWVIARREIPFTLPPHYVMVLTVRGATQPNEFQVKLVDPSGANVWWWRRRDFVGAATSTRIVFRRATLEFAWGPLSGGEPHQVGALEIALAAGHGGPGTIWIEDLYIEPREKIVGEPQAQAVRASSFAAGDEPAHVLASDERMSWQPAAGDAQPWLELDLGRTREWGGLVVDFLPPDAGPASRLLASDDGQHWKTLTKLAGGTGSRQWLRTADGDGRFARIEFAAGSTPSISHIRIVSLELAVSPSRYITAQAHAAPRGRYPRHVLGEQTYWAVVSADGDEHKGLLSEDGALEVDAESFSIEPFLWTDGKLLSWADVESKCALAERFLPVPSVEWSTPELRLRITACAAGTAGESTLVGRYRVENRSDRARRVRLLLAIRPFQVNPAWQSLNIVGGVAPLRHIECGDSTVRLNGGRRVVAITRADAVGAARSEEGLSSLANGQLPTHATIDDPVGFAEAVLAFDLALDARGQSTVAVAVPLGAAAPAPPSAITPADAAAWANQHVGDTIAYWRGRLATVPVKLPSIAQPFADSLHASLAWILVNRVGPRIQPGPRCYRRSWIRDGTLTGTALAEMGFADEPRAFLRWYAPFQLGDGRIPCAVDRHDVVDPAVEHDSHGEFAWGVVAIARLTGDEPLLRELWPRVLHAVDAIAALRAQRTTDQYRGQPSFGLLPESISHEGYSSHPVHAYWDDFFAVLGLAEAAEAAAQLGDSTASQQIGELVSAMRDDLRRSIVATIAQHKIEFLPGSVELGDFDPTSTAAALDPCDEAALLPPAALTYTFERYWSEFEDRRSGRAPAEAYTPYEVRNAAALVLMGQKQRAVELLQWLIDDQRPAAWLQWPEIAWHDRTAPRFFGDLPHGWVASTFVRAVRRMLVYERSSDAVLVLAAGVPEEWIRDEAGVCVQALPTRYGLLDYTMRLDGDAVRVTLGPELPRPTGGIIIESPLSQPLRRVVIDDRAQVPADTRRVHLHAPATDVLLEV